MADRKTQKIMVLVTAVILTDVESHPVMMEINEELDDISTARHLFIADEMIKPGNRFLDFGILTNIFSISFLIRESLQEKLGVEF